jgi:hypothetical protein
MPTFIINSNQQPNGDHEVHNTTTGCAYMPALANRVDLGSHLNCQSAVADAKRRWPGSKINGGYYCANACHTG